MRVTPDALRQIRGGHPWVYDASIRSVGHDGAAGDLAVVFDDRRQFAAIGLYDPGSPIRVRVLHHGGPATIDDDWWRDHLAHAFAQRSLLDSDQRTNAYRVVHGENDGFPGLVIDRYDTTYVVKAYTTAWLPHLRAVVGALGQIVTPERVVLRLGRTTAREAPAFDGVALLGRLPTAPVPFMEEGLSFEADVVRGQKTGHFLDQRENRVRVGGLSAGAPGARRVRLHRRVLGPRRGRWRDRGAERRPQCARPSQPPGATWPATRLSPRRRTTTSRSATRSR